MSGKEYIVWGGNGHRRLRSFTNEAEAHEYGRKFDQECWSLGVPVPPYHVTVKDQP